MSPTTLHAAYGHSISNTTYKALSPYTHYQLTPSSTSLAFDISGQPHVDRQQMSARAVISTATLDRVGDVLVPGGCQIDNYRKNPVVLWAHGLEGIGFPIGTSRDPGGEIAVSISKDDVQATCWFSQSSLEAAQIFELIDEGIVRATSVRETPLKSRVRRDPELGDILIVEQWELEEWSWCAVGVNPDAVAKTLHRNQLGGAPIIPSIAKSLTAVAPLYRRFGIGIPREKTLKDSSAYDFAEDSDDQDASSVPPEATDGDSALQPYGSTVIAAAHGSLVDACQNIEDAMGPLENPTVKEGLHGILSILQEQLLVLEGLHGSTYPDRPTLKDDDAEGGDEGDAMKAFLAAGQMASLHLFGIGARLKGLLAARNLTKQQRQTVTGVSQQLAKLATQSKSRLSEADEDKRRELQQSIDDLQVMLHRLNL